MNETITTPPPRIAAFIPPRALPFIIFMLFIAMGQSLQAASKWGWVTVPELASYYVYPIKTIAVASVLSRYWGDYHDLCVHDLRRWRTSVSVCAVGVATCVLWISMDWTITGAPTGFDITLLPEGPLRVVITAFRITGAVVVVPVMEELFWRSFMLRYLINADYESVPIGQFTWSSFLITTLLFGLEHHFVIAGMVAGAVFNLVLYKTRSLAQCVLAHAVTNLALACYVLHTGKWYFW